MRDLPGVMRLATTLCPRCGATISAALNMDGHSKPDPGDLTMCLECAEVLTFGPELQLQPLTVADLQQMVKDDPELPAELAKLFAMSAVYSAAKQLRPPPKPKRH